ncbi:MAG: hypothetical protein D6820_17890 [Lentisphaerae bacterium]|nr:MAG: hypothetical protein D6820_17890 [Lentisphaerota bacterium]
MLGFLPLFEDVRVEVDVSNETCRHGIVPAVQCTEGKAIDEDTGVLPVAIDIAGQFLGRGTVGVDAVTNL